MKLGDRAHEHAELVHELRQLRGHMTASNERLIGRLTNHVLQVVTSIIPTNGHIDLSWGIPAGAIEIDNCGGNLMTVESGLPGAAARTSGTGVILVPAGTRKTVNLASRVATIWGTPGDSVSIQVWTVGAQPGPGGINAVDGGAP